MTSRHPPWGSRSPPPAMLSGCSSTSPLDRFYSVIPAGRHRIAALAALPRRRAEVPARPHRIRADAAAGHLGPARPAVGRSAHHGRHRARPPRRGRGAAPRARRRQHRARERAARLVGRHRARRRDPGAPRAGCDHRLVRGRSRDQGRPLFRKAVARRSPPPTRATSRRSASRRPSPPSGSATSSAATELDIAERRARRMRVELRREARPRDRRGATSPTASTSGTAACSSPAPTSCSIRCATPSPSCVAGLEELAAAWDDPATRGPAVDRIWPGLAQDRDRLLGRRAGRRGRPTGRHPRALRVGRRGRLRVDRQAATRRAGKADLAILGENARVLADASSGIVVSQIEPDHLAHRRARHRRRRHPRCAPRHHEGERAAGEERSSTPCGSAARATCSEHARKRGCGCPGSAFHRRGRSGRDIRTARLVRTRAWRGRQ